MIVIVGHGPSIVGKGLGPWLDGQTVVRLKRAEIPSVEDWGSRTDVVCATSLLYRSHEPFWYFPKRGTRTDEHNLRVADSDKWRGYFAKYSAAKGPSTGLSAIFCAVEFLGVTELGLAGFDNLLYPDDKGWAKWWQPRYKYYWDADSAAEHKAAQGLGIKLVDVTRG